MKRILYITLVVLAVIPAACKQICPEPEPEPIGREEFPGNVIYYTSTDNQPIMLNDINVFSSDYVATYYKDGQGVFLFADNLEAIPSGAFKGCDKLKSVGLSPYIKTIEDDAFAESTNLESVSFPNGSSLKTIGKRAFAHAVKIKDFVFPASLQSIDDYAFDGTEMVDFYFKNKDVTVISDKFVGDSHGFLTIRVDNDAVERYRENSGSFSQYVMGTQLDLITGSDWTYYLPQGLKLRDLTIPCTHDAGTWSCSWHSPWNNIIKDQDYNFSDCYAKGVRAFDLRLGVAEDDAVPEYLVFDYYFCHGSITQISLIRTIWADSQFFPTTDQLEKSFMILFAKDDYDMYPFEYLHCFTELIEDLKERMGYNYDRYIAYNDDLTLADVQGKILLFSKEDSYCLFDKIPMNHITSTEIQVYRNGKPSEGEKYDFQVQDEYEVNSKYQKVNIICNTLSDRKNDGSKSLFQDAFNATVLDDLTSKYMYSWPVIEWVNPYMHDDLLKDPLDEAYQQPLGIVFYDMCGVDESLGHNFCGDQLTTVLWQHNYHGFWNVSRP